MVNKLPQRPSYTEIPQPRVFEREPTIGEAFSAQWGAVFSPIYNQNKFFIAPEYEAGSVEAVDEYIDRNKTLSQQEITYLRNFSTSRKALEDNIDHVEAQRARARTISKLSGPTAYITNPAFAIDVAMILTPMALANIPKFMVGQTIKSNLRSSSRMLLLEEGIGIKGSAKLGAFYGATPAVVGGVTEAATDLSLGDADAAILQAKQSTYEAVLGGVIGAAAGAGLSRLAGRPMYSDVPLMDGTVISGRELAERKLAKTIKKAKTREAPVMSPEARARRTARNAAIAEDLALHIDDMSGEGPAISPKFKNEDRLKRLLGVVPTPFRDIMFSKLPDVFKNATVRLAGDLGLVFSENANGAAYKASVHMKKALRSRDWGKALTSIDEAYREVNPRRNQTFMGSQIFDSVEKVRKLIGKDSFTLADWYEQIGHHVINNTPVEQIEVDALKKAVVAFRDFMKPYTDELTELGLINSREVFVEDMLGAMGRKAELISVSNAIIKANRKWMAAQRQAIVDRMSSLSKSGNNTLNKFIELEELIQKAESFDDLMALRPKLDLTEKMDDALISLKKGIDDLAEQIDSYEEYLSEISDTTSKTHFPRMYKRDVIRKRRDEFEARLMKWFRENPEVKRWNAKTLRFERVTMPTDPESVAKRAAQATDNILDEVDHDDIEMMFTGKGKSGPLASRTLDIPNELIEDFIVTDVKDIMIAYSDRVGARIEFHKAFAHPTTGRAQALEDIIEQLQIASRNAGASEADIEMGTMNFVHLYDSIVGTVMKNPATLDNKIAQVLRSMTSLTFLGRAGIAAVGDLSALFMDHDMRTIGKVFLAPLMDDKPLSKVAKEMRIMGDLLEIDRGAAHVRFMEGMSTSPLVKNTWDKMNNAFYNLNGLNMVTMTTKLLEGGARGHTLIERSQKLVAGKASKFEIEFLARNGIDLDLARKIVEQPFEVSNSGLILPNTSQWTDIAVKDQFEAAMRAGIMNRVIMGTPADRPKIMDGVVYLRKATAQKFGLPMIEDPRVPGYVRYESGLMALPFTFYSYTMGALTKITGNYAQGAVNNKAAHVAASLIIGGLIVKARTPEWAWDKMSEADKIARALDFSGLAALHTDMAYRTLTMAAEFGVNIEDSPIQPKFKTEYDPAGAAISVFGAPADYAYGVGKAITNLANGEVTDGSKQLINSIPFIGALAFQGTIKDTLKAIAPTD